MKKKISLLIAIHIFVMSQMIANAAVAVFDNNANNFPTVETKFMLTDNLNRVVVNADTANGNIGIFNNGQQIAIKEFYQASQKKNNSKVVIAFDLGIGNRTNNIADFNYAKTATNQCISYFNDETTQISLLSFSDIPSVEVDFTSTMTTVANFISNLSNSANTNIYRSFATFATGSIAILSELESENKSVLLVTQGIINTDERELIVALANEAKIKINILYISNTIPENIKRIAFETGGFCVNKNDLTKNRLPFLSSLAKLAEGYEPYKIAADANINCDGHHLFSIRTNNFSTADFEIDVEQIKLSAIEPNVSFLEFPSVEIGTSLQKNITLTSRISPIRITSINTDNPLFVIESGNNDLPKTLNVNEEIHLTISYNPLDSSIAFSRLVVVSDACLYDTVFLTGGYPNVPPNQKTIHFINPKCNDILVIGDTVDISWRGVLPKDVVSIVSHQRNNDQIDTFAKNIMGLEHRFIVPDIGEDSLRFYINQMWPNNVGKTLNFNHDTIVTSAFFNTLEDKIITVTRSRTVIIWNSNNGELIYTFPQFSHSVEWAVFCGVENSIEDKYIGIACQDSMVYIYNAADYSLKFAYRINHELANSIEFSKDGKYAVATYAVSTFGGVRGYFDVIDVTTGIRKARKEIQAESCRYAQFHPTKEYEIMAISHHDGIIRFFDIDGNQTDSINVTGGAPVVMSNYATYNWDGSKILFVNTTFRTAQLIDRNTKQILFSISHDQDDSLSTIIRFASFFHSKDEEYILTTGTDRALRRWNVSDGQPSIEPSVFSEHTQTVNTGVFNSDGWRVLSASDDYTAKIWNLNQLTLQADTTCWLKVAYARAEYIDTVDFGSVYLGDMSIRTIENAFSNICDFAYNIRSINIIDENPADSDFVILDEFEFPLRINANADLEFNIIFRPIYAELRTAKIQIILPNDTIYIVLRGIGVNVGLSSLTNIIDFGNVAIDNYKDMLIPVAVNVSGGDIDIKRIYFLGPHSKSFREFWSDINLPNGVNFALADNDTLFMPLRFFPLDEGRRNAVLFMEHSYHNFPMRWNLVGNGTAIIGDTVEVVINNISAEFGRTVDFPIFTNTKTQNTDIQVSEIILSFTFNSSLLFPSSISNEVKILRSSVLNGFNTVDISIPYKLGNQRIDGLRFLATWGNDTVTEIRISDVATVGDSRLFILSSDAIFTVINPCKADGLKLFDERGKLELLQSNPNPANSEVTIDFEIVEGGRSSLRIFDISGILVKSIFDEYKPRGKHSISISTQDLPRGTYYYTLETLTKTLTRSMIVD